MNSARRRKAKGNNWENAKQDKVHIWRNTLQANESEKFESANIPRNIQQQERINEEAT